MKDIEEFGRNRLLPVSAAFHQFPAMEVATNDATVLGPFYLSVVYGTRVAMTSCRGGSGKISILSTVLRSIPKYVAVRRRLMPSIITARRTF